MTTDITAYTFTDLTEAVRAAARSIVAEDMQDEFDNGSPLDRRRIMQAVLKPVNQAAHIIAVDVIGRVRIAMSAVVAHDVTCSTNFDDDAACDCTWAALEKAMLDLLVELDTPNPPEAEPKWEGSEG